MKVIAVMDKSVDPSSDCTVFICREAVVRGHDVLVCHPDSLSLNCGEPFGRLHLLQDPESWILGEPCWETLNIADLLLMRHNPPVDLRYLTTTYVLERFKGVAINDPRSVRDNPEKLHYVNHLAPPTLISEDREAIKRFCLEYTPFVIKPLYGYGGMQVAKCEIYDELAIQSLIDCHRGPIVVQDFCDASLDKRVFMLEGEILGAFARVPASGEFRANLSQGGRAVATELEGKEFEMCRELGRYLKERNLCMVGVDILGGYLTEINVTSPMGLLEIDAIYGTNSAAKCWDVFEKLSK